MNRGYYPELINKRYYCRGKKNLLLLCILIFISCKVRGTVRKILYYLQMFSNKYIFFISTAFFLIHSQPVAFTYATGTFIFINTVFFNIGKLIKAPSKVKTDCLGGWEKG
jgi:hypothetical protein